MEGQSSRHGQVLGRVGKQNDRKIGHPGSALLLLLFFLLTSVAVATNYSYDASGRLVAVRNDAGASARYSYDSMGNLIAVDRVAADQLAIFTFAPGRGAPGTTVKITGQGFNDAATQDEVKFNGVTATVVSAGFNELIATVPSGATTGAITVTVGSATARSATDFIVDTAALAPTIASVAPLIVAVGDQVTVSGQHLLPVAGQTSVFFNGRTVSATSLSDTQIVFIVPPALGSGRVTVTTPYGSATSSQDVVVVPTGVATSDIESVSRVSLDASPPAMLLNAKDKAVAVLYDASSADLVSLQFGGLGTSTLSYTVYGPTNASLASGSVSSSSPSVHLPKGRANGTYMVLLRASDAPASWTLAIEKAGFLSINGNVLSLPLTGIAQSKRLYFTAAAGQNLGLGLSELVTPNASGFAYLAVYSPDGWFVTDQQCFAGNDGCQVNLPNTVAGTYSVIVTSPYDGDHTMSFKSTLSSDVTGTLTADTAQTLTLGRRGQNERLSFAGTAGQTLALQVAGQATFPAGRQAYYRVYAPDGTT
ncbi:glutamate synthase, partial [Xanthomonas maliensis]